MYGIKERVKVKYEFDVFNLLITALKESGYRKYKSIVDYCHVMKKPGSDEMTNIIQTNVYLSEYTRLKEVETRLRYDREFLEHCLDCMEDYTTPMLERDTKFWQEVRAHKQKADSFDYSGEVNVWQEAEVLV